RFFFFSSRRRHTRFSRDWSSDVCSSDLDPSEALRAIAEHHVTKAMFVPAMLAIMLQAPDADKFDCAHLEDVIYGAAPMPSALLRSEERRVGDDCTCWVAGCL